MSPSWTLRVVVGVILAFGFSHVIWADNADIKLLMDEGQQAFYAANYPETLAKWQQGLELAKSSRNRQAIGDFLGKLGTVYDALGQYNRALEYDQQALTIHREVKDRGGEGTDLSNLGGAYSNLDQYDNAMGYLQQALAIRKEIKDRRGEGEDLDNLGIVYDNLGQYGKAEEYYQQALAINREIKDRRGEGDNLSNLGGVYWCLGQYDKALEYHQQALAIDREIKDRRGEGNDLSNLGGVYDDLGQHDKALEYHQQALAIRKEIKDRRGEGEDLSNLGVAYDNLGQHDKALEYHRQALAIRKEIKDRRGEGDDLSNLAMVYEDLGQYDRALDYYQQALAIDREIKNRDGEGEDLTNLGMVYHRLGQHDKALTALTESLKICQEVGAPESLWKAQRGLGAVKAKLERYDEAIKHYRQALDIIEGLRAGLRDKEIKTAFMRDKLYVYDELLELLRSLHEKNPTKGYDRDSLEIFERKQGRLFLEEMGQSGARNFAGLPDQIRSRETALENRLDKLKTILVRERSQAKPSTLRLQTLENDLQQAGVAFQALKVELLTKYPDYYALKYPKPARLSELQNKILKPGEVMLVYGVMEDNTLLWVIGKEVFRLYTLPIGEKDLSQKVAAFRRTVLKAVEGGRGVVMEPGTGEREGDKLRHELYSLLFPAQVLSALFPGSRLYIIPTGPLYSLPFEALETQASGQPPHYLVEDYAVAYLSSASLLKILREAQARKEAQPSYPLLAFANPRYGKGASVQSDDRLVRGLRTRAYMEIMRGTFAELPETEGEAKDIKELLKAPDESKPLQLKEAASRSTVFSLNQAAKLSDYRYLVFACHGVLPGEVDRVVQPALVLSYPEQEGYLTMGDVFSLKLNAELVSLSACNTGRGSEVKGEGIMGLTRAFMYSGTPAVAVTLWSIESKSAKELNVGMYRFLSQKQGRAAALQEIKLALLRGEKGEQYRHPFFWAPLVVFGDGQ